MVEGSGRSEVYTFAILHDAARHALELAKATPAARNHNCLNALVASAFSLEGYLNHIGTELLEFWPNLERLSPREKLNVISSHLKLSPDFSKRPYQSFSLAFRYRNLAAHARTEVLTFDTRPPRDSHGMPIRPETEFERLARLEVAEQVVMDTGAIIVELHEAAGKGQQALWFTSHTEWSGPAE